MQTLNFWLVAVALTIFIHGIKFLKVSGGKLSNNPVDPYLVAKLVNKGLLFCNATGEHKLTDDLKSQKLKGV